MKFVIFLLCTVSIILADVWDKDNDPTAFSASFEFDLYKLGKQGKLQQTPWSDSYWPSFQSGIAHRWYTANPEDFTYKLYNKNELRRLSNDELASLSPAEKYDIFVGRYDYPTVQSEWRRTNAGDAQWEGLCHGWAPASLFYSQPNPITLTNEDGINVPFGSSDIKALLIYFVAEYQERSRTAFLADRCEYDIKENPMLENSTSCKDLNAGSFHVILANQIGIQNQGFVIDRDRSVQVWNQPMASFTSEVVGEVESSLEGASSAIHIATEISYAKETTPSWFAHKPYLMSEKYQYVVELDSNKRIIGGTHISWDRPDFAWKTEIADFSNYFASLKKIYESSINETSRYVRSRDRSARIKTIDSDHETLRAEDACFGTPVGYPNNHRMSWSIKPSPHDMNKRLVIHFNSFATERFRDKVKVYEGAAGYGPLVAVLHGENVPEDVTIADSSAYIVFTSDEVVSNTGFEACFYWI